MNRDDFKTLQQHWYRKLQKAGFRDIELNHDLLPVKSTVRADHTSFEYLATDETEEHIQLALLWDAPKYDYWSRFSAEAHQLPTNYKHRQLLIQMGEYGGYTLPMLQAFNLTYQSIKRVVRLFKSRWKAEDEC